ncbi:MAG TPA: signal peptidase I [Acidimicrobiia bacterium]|nr:signal peptidase I [Acidimicrobiia bacterium]
MRRFIISELSMTPALRPGDRLLAQRLRRPRRGRVVFFPHPGRPDFWLVKRIVGLPGERVEVRDGHLIIDGEKVSDPWAGGPTAPDGTWQVPPDGIFVLSDARHRTRADSRTLGPVPLSDAYVARLRYRRGD